MRRRSRWPGGGGRRSPHPDRPKTLSIGADILREDRTLYTALRWFNEGREGDQCVYASDALLCVRFSFS